MGCSCLDSSSSISSPTSSMISSTISSSFSCYDTKLSLGPPLLYELSFFNPPLIDDSCEEFLLLCYKEPLFNFDFDTDDENCWLLFYSSLSSSIFDILSRSWRFLTSILDNFPLPWLGAWSWFYPLNSLTCLSVSGESCFFSLLLLKDDLIGEQPKILLIEITSEFSNSWTGVASYCLWINLF